MAMASVMHKVTQIGTTTPTKIVISANLEKKRIDAIQMDLSFETNLLIYLPKVEKILKKIFSIGTREGGNLNSI
jgi:hypothetical protein